MALLAALRWWRDVGGGGAITVYTDSMYAINCTSKWGPAWKRRGWKRDSGEPLLNLDLIRPLVDMWVPRWRLQHVRGHQTGAGPEVWGNNWVDKAAVAGSLGEGSRFVVAPADVIVRVPAVASAPVPVDVIVHESPAPVPAAADVIVHVPPAPAPAPAPGPKTNVLPRVRTGFAQQADIRSWFGGGRS